MWRQGMWRQPVTACHLVVHWACVQTRAHHLRLLQLVNLPLAQRIIDSAPFSLEARERRGDTLVRRLDALLDGPVRDPELL